MAIAARLFQVPGPTGAPGTPGVNGTNGANAYSELTDTFVMPAEGADVQVEMTSTEWAVPRQGTVEGMLVQVEFAGVLEVRSVDNDVVVTLRNVAVVASDIYPDNAAAGAVIPIGARVTPTGMQGPTGVTVAGGLLAANNLSDVASVAAARTNLGLGTAAVKASGTGTGNVPVVDDAAGLTNGEMVRATAAGVESIDAATARTALGLDTMATQAAGAVNITGGAMNGTLGQTTPAAASVTTLAATGNVTASAKLFTPASAVQSLLAATAINPNAIKVKVAGNGGAVVLVATPTITAPAADGQLLLIQGTDGTNTVTLQDEATLAGTGLELGAATRVLGLGDMILLTWDATTSKFYEVCFSNN